MHVATYRSGMVRLLASSSIAVLLVACSNSDSDNPLFSVNATAYEAKIYRTEGGIPHIKAADFGSLGFGTGYAAAQDNFCVLARNLLKYRAALAEFFGPDDGNLDTDFFYKLLIDTGLYDESIDPEFEAMFAGYAAGFNRYLRDTGAENLPDPTCRGAGWIQQMSTEDVRRIHLTPAFLPNLASLIVPAKPPAATTDVDKTGASRSAVTLSQHEKDELAALANVAVNPYDKGSNAVAIGRDLSANQNGLLYANPHLGPGFEFRFYPMHQFIPGVTNLIGASTAERANIGFGTNGDIAWTNTVSTSQAVTFFKLDLLPGDPLSYTFDGEIRPIEPLKVTVNVLQADGSLSEASHTFYTSHHGFMVGGQFSWLSTLAFSVRIANEGARGFQGGALAYTRARTVRQLKQEINRYQSTPGINTIAADSSGEVLYGDLGPVANFTDQQLVDCLFAAPIFLGNSSACEWNTDPDSAAPGLLGASKQAFLYRTDYVTNSNDSYWLSNPEAPLTDVPLVQGDIEDERSLRTRSGLLMIKERQNGSDGLNGNKFDLDSLLDRMLSNQHTAGQFLRDDLVILCSNNPSVTVDGIAVDISTACPVLAAWDVTANLDSEGSHLFREFLRAANGGDDSSRYLPAPLNYAVPFAVDDPLNTPRGLNTADNPVALESLARAVQTLNAAGIALDARLGDIQSVTRNGETVPLHGGTEMEGVFNKMTLAFAGAQGYPEVTGSSSSWIMATEFTADGPRVKGILTYSLSTNPESPHFSDMTKLFSNKQWVDIPYFEADVEAAALETLEITEGTEQCDGDGWQAFAQPIFADENTCRDYFSDLQTNQITDFIAVKEES